ncbi:MAG: hypothetical protein KAI64_07160, partial [Thermoplasmata archaeon]|nr:hypothetical protein [Thermoplasmata archaeon]
RDAYIGTLINETAEEIEAIIRGGKGSGHHGHKGRPGEVGGSLPSGETEAFNPDEIPRVPAMPGFCYDASARWMVFDQGVKYFQAELVHGTVMGQGPLEGRRFGHAWVEIEGWVYDVSQDLIATKEDYYLLGQVEDTVFYTPTEARIQMAKTEHFGPWEESLVDLRDEEAKGWFR